MECSRHHVVTRHGDIENDIGDDCEIPGVKNQKDLLSGLSDGGWKEEQLMQNLKQDVHETFQGWHFFLKQNRIIMYDIQQYLRTKKMHQYLLLK